MQMKKYEEIIQKNIDDVLFYKNGISEMLLEETENRLKITLGSQLKSYLSKYGYVYFKWIELYGITENQGLNSDLISKTLNLREKFNLPNNYICIENLGDGDFIVCDEFDNIAEFHIGNAILNKSNIKFDDYLEKRFLEGIC